MSAFRANPPLPALPLVRLAAGGFRSLYRPLIEGAERIPSDGPAIIAGNHIHALDPLLVAASTPRRMYTLAKRELHDGCFGWLFRLIGSIPVDLESAHNRSASASALARLREGALVNLSPEAGRNRSGNLLLPFKAGAVALARAARCPIVPYAITGSYRPCRGSARVRFGDPMDVTDLPFEQALELLRNTVASMLIDLGHVPPGAHDAPD